jgi:hypothetical protein
VLFVILATTHIVLILLDLYLMQRFIIHWRVWLTHWLTGDWLDGDAHYKGRFIGPAHPAGHRHFHHRCRATGQQPVHRDHANAAVRFGQVDPVGGGVRADPVESVRAVDDSRYYRAEGTVLVRAALRVLFDGRRVLADH